MEYTLMPISELVNPNKEGIFCHMVNYYWPVTEDEKVPFYGRKTSPYAHPQCNTQRVIVERFSGHLLKAGIVIEEIRLIPIAFQPINISDYQ